jgi:hypothetical protein
MNAVHRRFLNLSYNCYTDFKRESRETRSHTKIKRSFWEVLARAEKKAERFKMKRKKRRIIIDLNPKRNGDATRNQEFFPLSAPNRTKKLVVMSGRMLKKHFSNPLCSKRIMPFQESI